MQNRLDAVRIFIKKIPEIKELCPRACSSCDDCSIIIYMDYRTSASFKLEESSEDLIFTRIISALEDAIKLNTCQVEKLKTAYEKWKNGS